MNGSINVNPLNIIEAVMDQLSPREQAKMLDDLITKYGLPRTLIAEMLGWLGADAEQVETALGDIVGRSAHLIPKGEM